MRDTGSTHRFSTTPVKRAAEDVVRPMVIQQLTQKGYVNTNAVMRRLVTNAEKIADETGVDPLAEYIYRRPMRWTNQFMKRMKPLIMQTFGEDIAKRKLGKPTKASWEEIQRRIGVFTEKLTKAVDQATAKLEQWDEDGEVVFLNMDETNTLFSYEVDPEHVYALKDSVQREDLPPTDGQTADKRSFSALCYHSTSVSFNKEVLLGEGNVNCGSMTMLCMPPGNGRRTKMERTIEHLQQNFDGFPGLRPRRYYNETSGLGRMDKPSFQIEMVELAKRMAKYEENRDWGSKVSFHQPNVS